MCSLDLWIGKPCSLIRSAKCTLVPKPAPCSSSWRRHKEWEANQEVNKEVNKEAYKEVNKEANKEANKEVNKEVNKEAKEK